MPNVLIRLALMLSVRHVNEPVLAYNRSIRVNGLRIVASSKRNNLIASRSEAWRLGFREQQKEMSMKKFAPLQIRKLNLRNVSNAPGAFDTKYNERLDIVTRIVESVREIAQPGVVDDNARFDGCEKHRCIFALILDFEESPTTYDVGRFLRIDQESVAYELAGKIIRHNDAGDKDAAADLLTEFLLTQIDDELLRMLLSNVVAQNMYLPYMSV